MQPWPLTFQLPRELLITVWWQASGLRKTTLRTNNTYHRWLAFGFPIGNENPRKMQRKRGRRRERKGGGHLTSVKRSKESWNQLKRWDRGRDGSRESTERLHDHQVLACALKALNSLSGLFLPTHEASSGPAEATWQSFSDAALHPVTLSDKSKGRSFSGSAVCILKRVLWSQTSFFSGNLVLTSLREEFPRRTSSYAPTKKNFYDTTILQNVKIYKLKKEPLN